MSASVAGSKARLGDQWLPIYLESPVWRFELAAGVCGQTEVVGLFLPSVDRVGRYFPLTFAALGPADDDWLAACEDAGFAALEQEIGPDDIAARIGLPIGLRDRDDAPSVVGGTLWWTDGSPRVPATRFEYNGMPDVETFMAMLGAGEGTVPHEDQVGEAAE